MRIRGLLETPLPGHREQLLAMQQALLEQGWDEATIKPPTVSTRDRNFITKYNLSLKSGSHKAYLEGRVEPDFQGDIRPLLSWYAFSESYASSDETSNELEPQGEEADVALTNLKDVLTEMQLLDALKERFVVLNRDVKSLPNATLPAGFIVSFDIADKQDSSKSCGVASVSFALHKPVKFYWSNGVFGFGAGSKVLSANSIDELVKICMMHK